MADPTPLLPPYNPSDRRPPSSVDEIIETCIGSTGLLQLLRAVFVAIAWGFDAQQTFINAFTDAPPTWHCLPTANSSCPSARTPCGLPEGSWSWDQPKHTSIISEWRLECANSFLVSLPASSYFVGCLVGGLLLATLADSFLGRKNMLFLSCLTMSLAAGLAAVSPNIWAYSAFRFVCGFGRATVGTTALVLSTEMVGKKWRDRVSIVGFFCFTLGFLSLPAIAYLIRGSSWRNLYLWTSIPSFAYSIAMYFLAKESPRWLLVRGRRDEAASMLKSIAKSNGSIINCSLSNLSLVEEGCDMDVFAALKLLLRKKWAFKRLVRVMIIGFGVGMVYYGMPLNVGNLGSNVYIGVTLNALAELPSSIISFFLIGGLNRRCSLLVFTSASGVCSLLCALWMTDRLRMTVEVISFFSACTAFNVLLIFSIELFPTSVRNSAISMVRQAIVFGGVFAPMLVAAGRESRYLSFGVFGLAIGCCGLMAACLPETRGSGMSDTMDEEECKGSSMSSSVGP